jgi:glutamate 5-kinase
VLVENNYIPIINENDTVATDEIKFGDNDKLSALAAALLNVDLLIIATNTDGIYTKKSMDGNHKETIKETADIASLKGQIQASISLHGTGGMATKIAAAEIAQDAKIETWIVNGLKENFIIDAINNTSEFTKIITK